MVNFDSMDMNLISFEIRDQQGLIKVGRVKTPNLNYYTPNLIFPKTEIAHWINREHNSEDPNSISLSNLAKSFGTLVTSEKNPFFISSSSDPLNLFNQSLPSTEVSGYFKNNPTYFEENLDITGNSSLLSFNSDTSIVQDENDSQSPNSIPSQPSQLSPPLPPTQPSANPITILSTIFPNTHYDLYSDYELAALKHRLDLYSHTLSEAEGKSEQQFILEIPFSTQESIKDAYLSWVKNHQKHLFGLKFVDIFKNLRYQNQILDWIFSFKEQTSSNLFWMVGGDIFPEDYGLAVYLGFDCIDTASLFYYSYKGMYISNQGRQWLRTLFYPPCSCFACQQLESFLPGTGKESLTQIALITYHNIHVARSEIRKIQQHIQIGTIRSYLEGQIHSSASAGSLLRLIDKNYHHIVNPRFKLCNTHPVSCIGVESYTRPEVQNFIQRVRQEITPAQDYKMVIILPCSAKKPYSKSKSHIKFTKVIRKSLGKVQSQYAHQIIITSPVGVIPRELENIFPVAHYDIPVTGEWDAIEINSTGEHLAHWLAKYSTSGSSPLILVAHVHGGYLAACKVAQSILEKKQTNVTWQYSMGDTPAYSPSSFAGTQALEEVLVSLKKKFELEIETDETMGAKTKNVVWNRTHRLTEQEVLIRATLDYQFGKGAGDLIAKTGVLVRMDRNPNYFEVFSYDGAGKFQIGRLHTNSGFLKLTPRGAQRLMGHKRNFVQITEENMQGSSVFAPILKSIDNGTHPGDEMIVLNINGEYLGVGELVRSPLDLSGENNGIVCKLRKKVKIPSQTSNSSPEPPESPQSDLDFLKEIES
ncbi:MAG: hypothetical protein E4G98_02285 [Promethearchaeota archaeon]|nr:MAG: hypothetical protein E4G98_02285 [Candidatus Lokiarchaeota archaeon]